jgi:hypothetical protein
MILMVYWELKFDGSESAYTIRSIANGLYVSFDGDAHMSVQLCSKPELKHFVFRPDEKDTGWFRWALYVHLSVHHVD